MLHVSALDVLHVICTQLRLGHLKVRVGDSLRRSEEIVKNLELCLSMQLLLLLLLLLLLIVLLEEDYEKMQTNGLERQKDSGGREQ